MRNLFGLLLILVIGFTSCEGRKTQNQALSESIEEFKKNVSLEVDIYKPEIYVEREVDTLLSNGYRVKIKAYSDMDNNVLFTKIKDTINYQTHYRNYKFSVSVLKDNILIYNESFDKQRVNIDFGYKTNLSSESPLHSFNNLGVLKSIQINEDPTYKNKVVIDILHVIPESDRYASHSLFIDRKGSSNIKLIDVN
ncbi:hypothetical protein FBALC1_10932 [Flavobacteriales bacterium ALC-1]|nr:hypothetical protein FBALC1_10932 [Flavobacteriales bacterium ALC-1]